MAVDLFQGETDTLLGASAAKLTFGSLDHAGKSDALNVSATYMPVILVKSGFCLKNFLFQENHLHIILFSIRIC